MLHSLKSVIRCKLLLGQHLVLVETARAGHISLLHFGHHFVGSERQVRICNFGLKCLHIVHQLIEAVKALVRQKMLHTNGDERTHLHFFIARRDCHCAVLG